MKNESEKLIDNYVAAWNSHDSEAIASLFSDDGVFESAANGTTAKGKPAIKDYFTGFMTAISDVKLANKSRFIAEDHITSEWVMSGIQSGPFAGLPATGKNFSLPMATIIECKSGKIDRLVTYYDLVTLLKQIGLMPGVRAK